jgi:oligopeptide/dipeptide ABC transporter ATP-binding protein
MSSNSDAAVLIEAKGLKKYFPVTEGLIFEKVAGWVKAVDGVDFTIYKGETFGLVGESGCGKTTTSRLLLLLEQLTAGSILFEGKEVSSLKGAGLSHYRQSLQAVFQDPTSALNPRMRVEEIVGEPIIAMGTMPKHDIAERVKEVLNEVGLNPASASLYPHEFSGGQRQRIAVARALAPSPQCIILDEPVSALDVSIRAQILNLLGDLQDRFGFSYLVIAHDLAAVKYMSKRVGVMYLGKLAETAESDELYSHPLHPYTQALLSAALPSHPDDKHDEIVLGGEVPSPLNPPAGCRFHPRCQYVMPQCSETEPPLKEVSTRHQVACFLHP